MFYLQTFYLRNQLAGFFQRPSQHNGWAFFMGEEERSNGACCTIIYQVTVDFVIIMARCKGGCASRKRQAKLFAIPARFSEAAAKAAGISFCQHHACFLQQKTFRHITALTPMQTTMSIALSDMPLISESYALVWRMAPVAA